MIDSSDHDRPDAIGEAAQDWLLRLTSGDVTAAELESFEAWRAADPRHRAAYEEVRALWTGIDGLRPAFAPAVAPTPAPARPARRGRGLALGRRIFAIGGLVAACLLLLMAAGPHPAGLLADHRTAAGEQATVMLPDGSVALLNTATAIDVDFSPARRQVRLLYGEALFEVRPDRARPFDVLAADGRTRAVGTAFAVRDAEDGATVTVAEGTVAVRSPAEPPPPGAPPARVEAGQQVTYGRGRPPGPVRALDAAAATAWRDGVIAIRNQPLAAALAEIGRYLPGRILLLRDTSGLAPVTARISLEDVDSGIAALAATHGLSVTRLGRFLTVLR